MKIPAPIVAPAWVLPAAPREDQEVTLGKNLPLDRKGAERAPTTYDPILLGRGERSVEAVVADDLLADFAEKQRALRGLLDYPVGTESAQELGKGARIDFAERPGLAERAPSVGRSDAAVLGDQREKLVDQSREMESAGVWSLTPLADEEANHSDRLDEALTQLILGCRARRDFGLAYIDAHDGGIAAASRPTEPLPHAGHRGRDPHLRNALHGADVDAHLERRRADSCRRAALVLQSRLCVLSQIASKAPVVGNELHRHTEFLTLSPQEISETFDGAPGVREDKVVRAPKRFEQVIPDRVVDVMVGIRFIFVRCRTLNTSARREQMKFLVPWSHTRSPSVCGKRYGARCENALSRSRSSRTSSRPA